MILDDYRRKLRSQTSDLWTDSTTVVKAVGKEKKLQEKKSTQNCSVLDVANSKFQEASQNLMVLELSTSTFEGSLAKMPPFK